MLFGDVCEQGSLNGGPTRCVASSSSSDVMGYVYAPWAGLIDFLSLLFPSISLHRHYMFLSVCIYVVQGRICGVGRPYGRKVGDEGAVYL